MNKCNFINSIIFIILLLFLFFIAAAFLMSVFVDTKERNLIEW